jgi:hypothetical protein
MVMAAVGWIAWGATAQARTVAPDGMAFAYSTIESHTGADADANFDVYLWNRGSFEFASVGPDTVGDGARPNLVFADGSGVLFTTANALVAEDGDASEDVYRYSGGVVSLVSTGPTDAGQGSPGAAFGGASDDGSRVFFTTAGRLVPEDTDDEKDIYERTSDGVTSLVSSSPPGVAPGYHQLAGLSSDGRRVIEISDEALVPQDGDTASDVYERYAGGVRLISQGTTVDSTPSANGVGVASVTSDAQSVVFSSYDRLTAGDRNEDVDLYQRRNGQTLLVTARSNGVSPACPPDLLNASGGRGVPCEPQVFGQSDDGAKILFTSPKPLGQQAWPLGVTLPAGDGGLFERTATSTRLIDNAPWSVNRIAADGSRYVVSSRNSHAPADTDDEADLYGLENGVWTLLTPGTTLGVDDAAISRDARVTYFDTLDGLVAQDTDGDWDTYLATPNGPVLASTGPADARSTPAYTANLGISDDGGRMFFSSMKPLVAADTDDRRDLYLRAGGATQLLSP